MTASWDGTEVSFCSIKSIFLSKALVMSELVHKDDDTWAIRDGELYTQIDNKIYFEGDLRSWLTSVIVYVPFV